MNRKWKECTDRAGPRHDSRQVMSSGERLVMTTCVQRTTKSF
jgi:hypothetical protein